MDFVMNAAMFSPVSALLLSGGISFLTVCLLFCFLKQTLCCSAFLLILILVVNSISVLSGLLPQPVFLSQDILSIIETQDPLQV